MGDAALDALLTAMQMGILVVSTTLAIASSARFMHSSGKAAFLALSAAAVSFLCSAVVFKIVAASVSAVLICFIENPHALKARQSLANNTCSADAANMSTVGIATAAVQGASRGVEQSCGRQPSRRV